MESGWPRPPRKAMTIVARSDRLWAADRYAAGRRYRPVATSMRGVQCGQNLSIVRPGNQLDGFSTRPVSLRVALRYDGSTSVRASAVGVGGRADLGAIAGAEHAPCRCRHRREVQG